MMNVPLKLRKSRDFTTPKGPDFRAARVVRTDIAGTQLSFKAPKHRPEHANDDPIYPEDHYAKDRLPLSSNYSEQDAAKGRQDIWRKRNIFYHAWAFYGPWFTGALSELRLTVSLFRPVNYPKQFSLFHPRSLEKVVGDYLDDMYSHRLVKSRNDIQEFIAPINWQPLNHLSVNAVRMEVLPQEFSPHRTIEHLAFFPLADDLMVRLWFEPTRFENIPRVEMDKLVNPKPMHDMIDNIINSIQLNLSAEAQAQQAKALEGLADTSLVKHFPPIKWDKLDEKTTQAILLEANQGG